MRKVYKAMTIAGSDASGGAGLEADLKTLQEFGIYAMAAVTTIVTMKPDTWEHEVFPVELSVIEKQIQTIVEGIGIDAMKTGMLGSPELVKLVADSIDKYKLKNVVIDPVMVCKGVDDIMVPTAAAAIKELLVKRATVITPNLIEAEYLSGIEKIDTLDKLKTAAEKIHELGAKIVVIKGGSRFDGEYAIDLIYDGKEHQVINQSLLKEAYSHGAGCTYSAAITAGLAQGKTPREALDGALKFIRAALIESFPLNKFTGPVRHSAWRLSAGDLPLGT